MKEFKMHSSHRVTTSTVLGQSLWKLSFVFVPWLDFIKTGNTQVYTHLRVQVKVFWIVMLCKCCGCNTAWHHNL